ncbi:MAG: hypothetical protein AAGN35_11925 [Bacteroidota bacterium]
MKKLEDLLEEFLRDPHSLGRTFSNPLSFPEEFMLNRLEDDLSRRVHALLDLALAGSAEIFLNAEQRKQVMELSRFQKSVRQLLQERGSLLEGAQSMN